MICSRGSRWNGSGRAPPCVLLLKHPRFMLGFRNREGGRDVDLPGYRNGYACQDPDKYIGLLHDDLGSSGISPGPQWTRPAMADMIRRMVATGGIAVHDQRCLYENGDILVEHSVMDSPMGPGKR